MNPQNDTTGSTSDNNPPQKFPIPPSVSSEIKVATPFTNGAPVPQPVKDIHPKKTTIIALLAVSVLVIVAAFVAVLFFYEQ